MLEFIAPMYLELQEPHSTIDIAVVYTKAASVESPFGDFTLIDTANAVLEHNGIYNMNFRLTGSNVLVSDLGVYEHSYVLVRNFRGYRVLTQIAEDLELPEWPSEAISHIGTADIIVLLTARSETLDNKGGYAYLSEDNGYVWVIGSLLDNTTAGVHELGHILGMQHTDDPETLMYPYVSSSDTIDPENLKVLKKNFSKVAHLSVKHGGVKPQRVYDD